MSFKIGDKVILKKDFRNNNLIKGVKYVLSKAENEKFDFNIAGVDFKNFSNIYNYLELIEPSSLVSYPRKKDTLDGGGKRFNSGKPRVELLVPESLIEVSRVWEFGAKKYGDHNWKKGLPVMSIIGCMFRHLLGIMKGEDIDPESGCMHAAHIICNADMLIYFFKRNRYKELDDRFKSTGEK